MIGLLAVIATGFIGGTTPVFMKLGLYEFPPLTLSLFRFFVASVFLFPFFLRGKQGFTKKDRRLLFCSFFFTLNIVLFSIGIQFTTAIVSQLLYASVPIVVGFLSHYILKERLTKTHLLGLVIASFGMLILLYQSAIKEASLSFGTPIGNTLTLLAVFSWSFYLVFSRQLTKKYSLVKVNFASFVTTFIFLLLLVPFEQLFHPFLLSKVTYHGAFVIFVLGIVSSVVNFFLVQVSVKRLSAFTASFFSYLGPLSGAAIAVPVLGEKITPTLFLSAFFILLGVFFATTFSYIGKHSRDMLQ